MRERRTYLFHCEAARHNVRVTCNVVLDRSKRPVQQIVVGCTYKTDLLCKIEFYPSSGDSQCCGVKVAQKNGFR